MEDKIKVIQNNLPKKELKNQIQNTENEYSNKIKQIEAEFKIKQCEIENQ